ncbi:hypothetical protein Kpol_339p10 [Vanderwaltozyma polyspora DSM 70294]|uniref:Cyclin N-terminal domain-containing protein n=1 Tax=Vanderwaltozyma polyspora (strain ATCC 22028 / DSM 70294 / BCRC 21397 / CBS 2163 / NBRC 10782 / NRRL Y-8283 / UCD 57-17) TaxID=436907 RepID=A7TSD8_VANPO|nr:uncharacterized protein Kpol_339p10 [Vanderwaltozyma polyspora DSM 70294]EDO14823.1 hypothetical protein Kpol_339p10 [Vanderwaltozyma polyspora DSM 70294]
MAVAVARLNLHCGKRQVGRICHGSGRFDNDVIINGEISDAVEYILTVNEVTQVLYHLSNKDAYLSDVNIQYERSNIKSFVKEVIRRSGCSKSTIKYATVYTKHIYKKLRNVERTQPHFSDCVKRIFFVSLIIAQKFIEDSKLSMASWSLVSGISQRSLCIMEKWCLRKLDYSLNVEINNTTPSMKRTRKI